MGFNFSNLHLELSPMERIKLLDTEELAAIDDYNEHNIPITGRIVVVCNNTTIFGSLDDEEKNKKTIERFTKRHFR